MDNNSMDVVQPKRWVDGLPEAFCDCFMKANDTTEICFCGENIRPLEWTWAEEIFSVDAITMNECNTQIRFHPNYSNGTGIVRSDILLHRNSIHYWEVKLLTEPYGTETMIGLITEKFLLWDPSNDFSLLMGCDNESYAMSYTGEIWHGGAIVDKHVGFRIGSIVGVKLDLWEGTLEFFLNRRSLGVSCTGLRRHYNIYPTVSSTARNVVMRLIYATSFSIALTVPAAKILLGSVKKDIALKIMPPGLYNFAKKYFFLFISEEDAFDEPESYNSPERQRLRVPSGQLVYRRVAATVDSPKYLSTNMWIWYNKFAFNNNIRT